MFQANRLSVLLLIQGKTVPVNEKFKCAVNNVLSMTSQLLLIVLSLAEGEMFCTLNNVDSF